MPKLIVSDDAGNEKTMSVSDAESSNDSRATDGCVDYWDMISKLAFKARVEILGPTESC